MQTDAIRFAAEPLPESLSMRKATIAGITVLVVDDEEVDRTTMTQVLQAQECVPLGSSQLQRCDGCV